MIDEETGEEWHFEHLRAAEDAYEEACEDLRRERWAFLKRIGDWQLLCPCTCTPCNELREFYATEKAKFEREDAKAKDSVRA